MTGCRGLTPVMGVVLLVVITVLLAAISAALMLGVSPASPAPFVNLEVVVTEDNVTVHHVSGGELEFDAIDVIIRSDAGDTTLPLDAQNTTGSGTVFEVGDTWSRTHGLSLKEGAYVRVLVRHTPRRAILYEDRVRVDASPTGPTPSPGTQSAVGPTAFNDGAPSDPESDEDESLPPSSPHGDLSNLATLQVVDGSEATLTELENSADPTDPQYALGVGLYFEDIAPASSHTLAVTYRGAQWEDFTITAVESDGTPIATIATITAQGTASTRTYTIPQSVSDHIDTTGTLYLVISHTTDSNTDNTQDQIFMDAIIVETA